MVSQDIAQTIQGMREALLVIQEQEEAARVTYEQKTGERKLLMDSIDLMLRLAPVLDSNFTGDEYDSESEPTSDGHDWLDFSMCRNVSDKLAVYVLTRDGVLDSRDAARALIAQGESQSAEGNLVHAIDRKLMQMPNTWEYQSPHVFRYLPYFKEHSMGSDQI